MSARIMLMASAIILSASISIHASESITVTCLAPNGGFTIDSANFTVLVYGESGDYEVLASGSLLQLWSCGWDDGCKWLSYTAYPGSSWEIVNVGGARIIMQQLVPTMACVGFHAPMANYPVTVRKVRALPLKAEIFDVDGFAMIAGDLVAPPIVQVWFDSGDSEEAIDVTDDVLAVGLGDEGNQFVFTESGLWQFNLLTRNYTAPGTYTVLMASGDESEYVLEPACLTEFVIE